MFCRLDIIIINVEAELKNWAKLRRSYGAIFSREYVEVKEMQLNLDLQIWLERFFMRSFLLIN